MKWIITLIFILRSTVYADLFVTDGMTNSCLPNQLFIGPEIYHSHLKHKNIDQKGWLYGIRAGYNYIQPCFFYFGTDLLYAKGTLKGKMQDVDASSKYRDLFIEGRAGYTFGHCNLYSFSPFIGGGYANEQNNYSKPEVITNELNYGFISAGFLSAINLYGYGVGLNFKTRYMLNSNHSCNNKESPCRNKFHYRIELPFSYMCYCYGVSFVPFYELRQYGKLCYEPVKFVDSTNDLYGFTINLLSEF